MIYFWFGARAMQGMLCAWCKSLSLDVKSLRGDKIQFEYETNKQNPKSIRKKENPKSETIEKRKGERSV